MSDSRVVQPETARLFISGGDWLLVKKRINSGENKRMVRRGMLPDGRVDTVEAGTATVLTYLVDWSVKGLDGQTIPILGVSAEDLEAAVDAIDPQSYTEILRAIEAHIEAVTAARLAEKNALAGEKTSAAISPSPSDAAGVTNGLPN